MVDCRKLEDHDYIFFIDSKSIGLCYFILTASY